MKIVIIGGGSAGMAAATRLRRLNEDARIVILEKNNEFAIASCGLTYLLSDIVKEADDLTGATVSQMQNIFKIEVKLNHEVLSIERNEKKVLIADQKPETYDKLIIATGALQLRPDIPGILGDNIFTIRTLSGIQRIKDYYLSTNASDIIILGAGDIGIEAAEAFAQLKAKVTLIDKSDHILPYFDADMTTSLEKELNSRDIRLLLNTQIKKFGDSEVVLDNGKRLKFDMAIIATGVKPDVKLPIMADLDIGQSGGILVNKYMQTNDANIYACGDNVEVINRITGVSERWPNASNALKQARVAAEHICGANSVFGDIIGTNICKVFRLTAAVVGCNETKLKAANIDYQKVYLRQEDKAFYLPDAKPLAMKLLFAANGLILGAQIIGEAGAAERIDALSVQMQHGGRVSDLIFEEVAFAPPYSTAKDIINNIGALAWEVLSGKLRYIDVEDLIDGITPVDVRNPENFALGHLPGAVNLPLTTLRKSLAIIPKDKKIALYCHNGYAAYLAYCILSQRGFNNAYLLASPPEV